MNGFPSFFFFQLDKLESLKTYYALSFFIFKLYSLVRNRFQVLSVAESSNDISKILVVVCTRSTTLGVISGSTLVPPQYL